ncbi:MAG: C-terminal binding protein [Candidatus Dormibacteraceae bacterium]
MALRVVVTDHVFEDLEIERSLLGAIGAEVFQAPATDEVTLAGLAREADAMLVCYAPITKAVIDAAAGRCRIMARYGIGYDNIPVEAATAAGILVTNVPDYCIEEVADHTVALLLACARGLIPAARSVEGGEWRVPRSGVHRLRGRRLSLLGLGRIGRRVAERALAFGLEVAAHDPYAPPGGAGIRAAASVEEAIAEADFISLHMPLTPQTRHLIGDSTIALMRHAPVLVNTSRGGLVDLDATVRALDDGRLAAVGLDVTDVEPLPPLHPLRSHPRALITPHMAFYSAEAQDDLQARAAEEVVRRLQGQAPRSPVNPQVLNQGAR